MLPALPTTFLLSSIIAIYTGSNQATVSLLSTQEICAGPAYDLIYSPPDASYILRGCWRLVEDKINVIYFDADSGQIPAHLFKKPSPL